MKEGNALAIAPWEPDKGPYNEGTTDAVNNVQPIVNGWGPISDLSEVAATLGEACFGGVYYRTSTGAFGVIVATQDKFWKANTSTDPYTWDDITGSTAPSIGTGQLYQFLRFGTKLLVVSLDTPVQEFDVDIGTVFVDTAGSPPGAKFIAAVGDFVVLGHLKEGATEYPSKWKSSGLNDHEVWTEGTKLADSQVIPDGDEIAGLIGGPEGGYVMQRKAKRALVISNDAAMAIKQRTVDPIYGVLAPYSLVQIAAGDYVYLAEDGFKRGDARVPIGAGRVDEYFLRDVNSGEIENVQGIADPINHIVWWRYTDNDSVNKMIGWDWELDRWCRTDADVAVLINIVTAGVTLEALDAIFLALYGSSSIDTSGAESLDSSRWKGGRPLFAAVSPDGILYSFTGLPMAAYMDTVASNLSGNTGIVAKVTGGRAMVDTESHTMAIAVSQTHGSAELASFGAATGPSRTGFCPLRGSGRLVRMRISVEEHADWSFCHGAIPLMAVGGRG